MIITKIGDLGMATVIPGLRSAVSTISYQQKQLHSKVFPKPEKSATHLC